jgi:hypothetical protein
MVTQWTGVSQTCVPQKCYVIGHTVSWCQSDLYFSWVLCHWSCSELVSVRPVFLTSAVLLVTEWAGVRPVFLTSVVLLVTQWAGVRPVFLTSVVLLVTQWAGVRPVFLTSAVLLVTQWAVVSPTCIFHKCYVISHTVSWCQSDLYFSQVLYYWSHSELVSVRPVFLTSAVLLVTQWAGVSQTCISHKCCVTNQKTRIISSATLRVLNLTNWM